MTAKVIDISKRLAWKRMKKMLEEGYIHFPARPAYTPPEPKTDMGLAFAYMAASLSPTKD